MERVVPEGAEAIDQDRADYIEAMLTALERDASGLAEVMAVAEAANAVSQDVWVVTSDSTTGASW